MFIGVLGRSDYFGHYAPISYDFQCNLLIHSVIHQYLMLLSKLIITLLSNSAQYYCVFNTPAWTGSVKITVEKPDRKTFILPSHMSSSHTPTFKPHTSTRHYLTHPSKKKRHPPLHSPAILRRKATVVIPSCSYASAAVRLPLPPQNSSSLGVERSRV